MDFTNLQSSFSEQNENEETEGDQKDTGQSSRETSPVQQVLDDIQGERVLQNNQGQSQKEQERSNFVEEQEHHTPFLIQQCEIIAPKSQDKQCNKNLLEMQLKEGQSQLEVNVNSLPEEILERKNQIRSLENNPSKTEDQPDKINLQKQLNDGLVELEIKDAFQLSEEIQETISQIQTFEKRGQQKQVSERRKYLEKLEHLQSVFTKLEKLKPQVCSENQTNKEQLEVELRNGLAELEIKDAQQLSEEIQERINLIQTLEKRGQQNKASERRKSLEKLEHLQSIFINLEKLKPSTSSENQIYKEQLEVELKNGFAELEIKDAQQLSEEIQERINLIQTLEKRGQQNKASERRKSLEKLEHLQSVFTKLEKLNTSISSENQTKKEQLEVELRNGLAELEIKDASQLTEEIQERINLIQTLEKRGQQNKASERRKSLEKLERLQSISQELEQITQPSSENQSKKEELENILKDGLNKLQMTDIFQLSEEIQEMKTQILNIEKKGQIKKATEWKKSLENLEHLHSVFEQLEALKNQSFQDYNKSSKNNEDFQIEKKDDKQNAFSSNEVKSKTSLKDVEQSISIIPECSEKSLLELLSCALQLQSSNQSSQNINNYIDTTNLLLKYLQPLNDRLKMEDLISQEVNDYLQKIEINIKSENVENVIHESEKLLKKLRPLNIQEMKNLIKKAHEAAELILGQDIILFLGGTGAGKSTTIHFLAGSKMVEIETQVKTGKFLKYIGPDPQQIKNKILQKITIGHQAESETRYITPVLVNFKDIGMNGEGSIVLCDAPGFGDTAGPEVDIANGIGIVEAIKGCKSVRPVILVSSLSIGDKGEGIKRLAHVLVGFVNRISDKLSSFSYLFTKYPAEANIHVQLLNIKNSVDQNQEESSDKSFVSLFDDMIEKTEEETKRIDPLKDKPSKILKSLISTEPIKNPHGVFQFSITESSKAVIQEQVRLHQLSIISAAKRDEYRLIEYKLDEMKFLIENLNQDFIKQAYSECANYIIEGLNKNFSETTAQFNRCIQNQNKLTIEDLMQYKKLISQFQEAENLRKTHLGTNVVQTSSLIQNLLEAVDTISTEFNQQNICNSSFKNNLDNIKLLSDQFPEIKQKYKHLCQSIKQKIENLFVSCQQILSTNDFSKLAEVLSQVKQYSILFKNHLNEDQILLEYQKVGESILKYLNQICDSVEPVLRKEILEERDVDQLKQAISLIESAKETMELKEHIKIDQVKMINENLVQKIFKYFESINKKIDESFKNEPENSFKEIEILVQQMGLIRKIEGFDSKTSEMYHKTIQGVFGYMQQLRRDAEQLLTNFHQQKENINFQKIYRCLTGLKNAQWMNNVRNGAYDDIMKNITEDMVKHAQKLYERLLDIDLILNHPENIQSAMDIVMQIDAMRPFEQTISELTQYRENVLKRFKIAIQNIFDFIQTTFNLQNKAVYQQKLNLKLLESLKLEYEDYNPERQYLRGEGFQTIEQLNEEITLKEIQSRDYQFKTENQILVIQQFLQKLNEAALKYSELVNKKQNVLQKITTKFKDDNSHILKEVNCSSIQEVYEHISQREKEIEKLQDQEQAQKQQKEIERLKYIQNKYNEIQMSKTTSQEGQVFLINKGYQNIKLLDQEISHKSQIILSSEQKDQEYVFSKLDGSVAESAFRYLEACKKIRWVKEDANNTYLKLKDYMTKYGDFMQQEMQTSYQKVQDAKLNEINEVSGSAQKLAFFLQEICELEKQPTIFEFIKGKDAVQNWRNTLTHNFIQLSDDMNQMTVDKQDLRNKITIVKALSQIDFILAEPNKYFTLYRQFQNCISNEFKEVYKRILELIERNDFKMVSIELLEIDENPINERAFGTIKHNINVQVMDLVEQAKMKAIMLGSNLDIVTIQFIVDNLNKIETAKKYLGDISCSTKKKSSSQGYLDETNLQIIEKEFKEIQDIVAKKIARYLESIEALLSVSDFYEAEEKREYINQVRHLLGRFCENSDLSQKIENLQNRLEAIVGSVLQEYDNMQFQDYILRPPKQILDKLQKVSSRSIKYTEFLNKMKQKIVDQVRKNLKEIKESTPDERNQHIQRVETALCSIPDEMKSLLVNEFESCKQLINQKEAGYQVDYERAIISGDLSVQSKFMEKCRKDQMYNYENQIKKEIVTQVQNCKDKIKETLNDENIKQTLDQAKKLADYKDIFGKSISDIENAFADVQVLITNKLNKMLKFLMSISQIENCEEFEKGFDGLVLTIEFKNETTTVKSSLIFFGEDFDSKIQLLYQKLSEYFIENQQKFNQSQENLNILALNDSVSIIKKWNQLLKKIKSHSEIYKSGDQPILQLTQIVENCKLLPEAIKQVTQLFKSLKSEILSFEFFQGFQDQRNEFYYKLDKKLKALQIAKDFKENFQDTDFDLNSYEKDCIPFFQGKLQKAEKTLIQILENKEILSKKDFDLFNLQYDNAVSLEKNVKILDIQPKKIIEAVEQKLNEKVTQLQSRMINSEVSAVADCLTEMKTLSDNIPSFKSGIDQSIDDSLKIYMNKNKQDGGITFGKLVTLLESEPTGVGLSIISEHKCFRGQSISIFNQQTQKHGIEYILKRIEGDKIEVARLQELFYEVKGTYDNIVKKYIVKLEKKSESEISIIDQLICEIKSIPSGIKPKKNKINWEQQVRDKIPSLIAHIFALWTLKNTEYYNEMKGSENRDNFLLQPHAGQIISILRLLGIGYGETLKVDKDFVETITFKKNRQIYQSEDDLQNNLIQIGTGEGKSVTLAVASAIFALFGIDVSCACYSEYLSNRDYNEFLPIFESLGITQYIKYGPFNKICENIINEKGDIRELVIDFITNGFDTEKKKSKQINIRPRVLLIDEVDVFFNKDFYGNVYNPLARLKDPTIGLLTNFIWENRGKNISIQKLMQTSEYKNCCNKFKNWEFLINEAVKDMLSDLTNFKHDYIVLNDKIAYKEQDGISYDVNYGYKTLFAYYQENENGKISKNSLDENIFIGIRCGSFSYAQIPHMFEFIVGVTGTLKTLSEPEKNIVQNIYKIKKNTYIPSVFGENKRIFADQEDIYVENAENYFKRLRETLDHKIKKESSYRAILVFFESKQKLMEFYNSQELAPIKGNVQVITEEVSTSLKEKNFLIKRATTSNQITLLTRSFGRGTDFVCRDQQVLSNGGVHVIQAFFSEELSEEIQIMGRCARQGEDGSFNMILLDEDLEKILGPSFKKDIEEMRSTKAFYRGLDKQRAEQQKLGFKNNNEFIQVVDEEHKFGQQFIQSIHSNNGEFIRKFLGDRNKGSSNVFSESRILCLVDATSSMGSLLNQAKNTVSTMFSRASQILKDNGIPEDSFQLQFAVYRDYDCKIEGVLQSSPWESKAENLRQFLEKIKPKGGGDYEEAIEIGLWHANQENQIQDISQIILIGDAPAKSQLQIKQYRELYGGESYWKKSKFQEMTFYKDEMEKLKMKGIPIHSFYLDNGAKSNFEEIATNTGGRCEKLDVNSTQSSAILTNIVTEQILLSVGQATGKGEELVDAYKKLFSKSYK